MTKKPTRSQVKNPALKKGYNSRIRQEYLDYDYIDKLSEEEKTFLNQFTEEWLNSDFRSTNLLDGSIQSKRDSYNRNNARNRCLYSIAKARDAVVDVPEIETYLEDIQSSWLAEEDLWIKILDGDIEDDEAEIKDDMNAKDWNIIMLMIGLMLNKDMLEDEFWPKIESYL